MAKCDGCGLSTGTTFQAAYGKLLAKASTAKRCPACKTLVILGLHPRLKA